MLTVLAAVNGTAAWPPDPVATAGVHATVISIVITVVLAFAAFVYERTDSLRLAAVERALRVNQLPVPGFFGITTTPSMDASDESVRGKLIIELMALLAGVTDPIRRLTPAERGKRVLEILVTLTTHRPFPSPVRINRKGKRILTLKAQPVHITTREEAEAWVKEVRTVYGQLWLALTTFEASIRDLIEAYRASREEDLDIVPDLDLDEILKDFPAATREDAKRVMNAIKNAYVTHPQQVYDTVWSNLQEANKLALQVEQDIERSRLYERTHAHWSDFLVATIITAVAFTAGVILPLIMSDPPYLLYVGVPILFYAASLGYIVWALARRRRRSDRRRARWTDDLFS